MKKYSLHVTKTGGGENPVLFLHGLWGGGNYFRKLDFSKIKDSSLYFPDELGFGNSPKPALQYTPRTHSDAIANSVPKNRYIIIGNSLGANLAVFFSYYYPYLVKKLILISPLLYKNSEEAKKYLSRRFITRLTIYNPQLAHLVCLALCKTQILSLVSPFFVKDARKILISGCTKHTWHTYYSTFTECLLKMPIIPLIEKLSNRVPIFILYGENDKYISQSSIKSLQGKLITGVNIENGTHNLLFENQNICMKFIQDVI